MSIVGSEIYQNGKGVNTSDQKAPYQIEWLWPRLYLIHNNSSQAKPNHDLIVVSLDVWEDLNTRNLSVWKLVWRTDQRKMWILLQHGRVGELSAAQCHVGAWPSLEWAPSRNFWACPYGWAGCCHHSGTCTELPQLWAVHGKPNITLAPDSCCTWAIPDLCPPTFSLSLRSRCTCPISPDYTQASEELVWGTCSTVLKWTLVHLKAPTCMLRFKQGFAVT